MIAPQRARGAGITNTGTHRARLLTFGPTGKSFRVPDFAVYRIEHSRTADQWGLFALFSVVVQLGLITLLGGAEPR